MKKRNILAKLLEETTINLHCVAKVEISEDQLLVNNEEIATESDDDKLFDFAMVAISTLLSCGFDVAFINHDTGKGKYFKYEN